MADTTSTEHAELRDDFTNMSVADMQALIARRYEDAVQSGLIAQLGEIARLLGDSGNSEKYTFQVEHEDDPQRTVTLFVDDYGGYITAHVGTQKVMSTHQTNRFIIPGPWVDEVLAHAPAARDMRERREAAVSAAERARLMKMLV